MKLSDVRLQDVRAFNFAGSGLGFMVGLGLFRKLGAFPFGVHRIRGPTRYYIRVPYVGKPPFRFEGLGPWSVVGEAPGFGGFRSLLQSPTLRAQMRSIMHRRNLHKDRGLDKC